MSESTLFIPDITGFTKFVKSTEINHGKHIIEELINIIITQGKRVFEVAEVEGDAVFLYKEKLITPEKLINQAKQIFIAFHKHLLDYEQNRICECGACTSAVGLRLKFIAHSGDMTLANYGTGKAKPFGDAVITVHRLLKNDVPLDQYVLLTDDYLSSTDLQLDGQGMLNDDSLGKIHYRFLNIDHWKSDVLVNKKDLKREKVDLEVSASDQIAMKSISLHRFISEFKYRHLWNKEADEIIFDEDEINKSGTEHFCVIKGKDLRFDTIKPEYEAGLAYGEILKNPSPLKYFEADYFISDSASGKARLKVVIRASLKWRIQKIMLPLIRKRIKEQATKIIKEIRQAIQDLPESELAA